MMGRWDLTWDAGCGTRRAGPTTAAPCPWRCESKLSQSMSRSVDAGIAQVEAALEVVAIGVPHLAVADGPCQLLTNGVAPLPVTYINKFCADELHVVVGTTDDAIAHIRRAAVDFHLLAHLDAEGLAAQLQIELLAIVGFDDRRKARAAPPFRQRFAHLHIFLVDFIMLSRRSAHRGSTIYITAVNIDEASCCHSRFYWVNDNFVAKIHIFP